MAIAGQIVLFKFPKTDLTVGKLRPALLIKLLSNGYDDCLVCMISTKTGREIPNLDEIISPNHPDFVQTGLKSESVIRVSRLAIVLEKILLGKIGKISTQRLEKFKETSLPGLSSIKNDCLFRKRSRFLGFWNGNRCLLVDVKLKTSFFFGKL